MNPLISIVALYFLIKTYVAQKEELSATREALEESASHQKLYTLIQMRSLEISSKYEEIKFMSGEIERCTVAMNADRFTFNIDGKKLFTDEEIGEYRMACIGRIRKLRHEIWQLQNKTKEAFPEFN